MAISRLALLHRYRQLAGTLARHGLGYLAVEAGLARYLPFHRGLLGHRQRAEPYTRADHLRLALEELGPTFIKLGQILSTRPDLIPSDWTAELAKLQEHAPLVPWDEVRLKLERELGSEAMSRFASIEPAPLAAASLGQVHKAVLATGEAVAVKVQRPGVRAQIDLDLEVLRRLARRAARRPIWRAYDPEALVEEFALTLAEELDYVKERHNSERYARHLPADGGVRVPRVHAELSGPKVLTLELIEGVRIDDSLALHGLGMDQTELARRLARLLFRSALEWGFFHADPHLGNFRVTPRGELVILDFGMMGYLDRAERHALLELVLAAVEVDARRVGDRLADLGVDFALEQRAAFQATLGRLLIEYVELPLGKMPMGDILHRLLAAVRDHRLRLPAHLAMFTKTIIMAEGVGRDLDPDFRLEPVLKPLFERALIRRFSTERARARFRDSALDLLYLLEEAPSSLRRLTSRLERSGPQLQMGFDDRGFGEDLERIANDLRRTGLVMAAVIALALLMLADHPPGWESWIGALLGGLIVLLLGLAVVSVATTVRSARGRRPR